MNGSGNDLLRDGIVRLLETRDENYPVLSRQSAVASGFAHKARSRTCPDCVANGRVSPSCETCFGRGHVDPRYAPLAATDVLPDDGDRRDPYSVNEKTAKYGLDGSRHDAAYRRDREIEALGMQTRPAPTEEELLAEANARGFGWEEARRTMYRRFDYAALDRALDDLRLVDDVACRALHMVYVYEELRDVSGAAAVACERGLTFLVTWFRCWLEGEQRDLRAPAVGRPMVNTTARGRHADQRALDQRNNEIRRAHREGASITDLEARYGLKKSALYEIINGVAA